MNAGKEIAESSTQHKCLDCSESEEGQIGEGVPCDLPGDDDLY